MKCYLLMKSSSHTVGIAKLYIIYQVNTVLAVAISIELAACNLSDVGAGVDMAEILTLDCNLMNNLGVICC